MGRRNQKPSSRRTGRGLGLISPDQKGRLQFAGLFLGLLEAISGFKVGDVRCGNGYFRHKFRSRFWHSGCGGSEHDARRLSFYPAFHVFALVLAFGFRPGNRHFTAHEGLVVEHLDRADSVVHAKHFDESVALGPVRTAVINNLDIPDSADALEQFLEILLGDVVGEISDVNAGGFHALRVATTGAVGTGRTFARLALFTLWTRFTRWAGFTRLARFARWTGVALFGAGIPSVGLGSTVAAREWSGLDLAVGPFCSFISLKASRQCGFFVESDGLEDFLPESQLGRCVFAWSLRAEFVGTGAFFTTVGMITMVTPRVARVMISAVTPSAAAAFVVVIVTVLASA